PWEAPFRKAATRKHAFRVPGERDVQVPMMYQHVWLRHGRTAAGEPPAQVLELPYQRSQLSMVVGLPGTEDGGRAVEAGLSAGGLGWARGRGGGSRVPGFQDGGGADLAKQATVGAWHGTGIHRRGGPLGHLARRATGLDPRGHSPGLRGGERGGLRSGRRD